MDTTDDLMMTALKLITGVGVAVVGWFCKNIIHAQRETDIKMHETQRELDKHKLDVAQNYQSKVDAVASRNEYREELKRVHDRIDAMAKESSDNIKMLSEAVHKLIQSIK